MQKQLKLFISLLFASQIMFAQQTKSFVGQEIEAYGSNVALNKMLSAFKVFSIDSKTLKAHASTGTTSHFVLSLENSKSFDTYLVPSDVRAENYRAFAEGPDGVKELPKSEVITYQGTTTDGAQIAMTINDGFIYGKYMYADVTYYIEPLSRFVPNCPADLFLFYKVSDVKPDNTHKCGASEVQDKKKELIHGTENEAASERNLAPAGCLNVSLGIASDFSMFTLYSNTTNISNHSAAVVNDINTDYDNDFNRLIKFNILTEFFVTTSSSCAETYWKSTNDNPTAGQITAGKLLGQFASWATGGSASCLPGTFSGYDLGALWTDLNITNDAPAFDPNVIGLAYVGGVCTSNAKFQLLEDFAAVGATMRCMVSHETGHNFNCNHDASGSTTIMAPFVSTTTSWSGLSIGSLNVWDISAFCTTGASALTSGTPIAAFALNAKYCKNEAIALNNRDARNPTSWSWSMPSGSPASAATANSSTTYATAGIYNISHTATNAFACPVGGSSNTLTKMVNIINFDPPTATCPINSTNTSTTGNFLLGPYRVELVDLNAATDQASVDGAAYLNNVCNQYATLVVQNGNVLSVDVNTFNTQTIRAYIDYDNDGAYAVPSEQIMNITVPANGGTITTVTSTFNVPSTAQVNKILRLRVTTGTSNPCTTPAFGQVEDYGVLIPNAVLPISLLSFTGKYSKGRTLLNWVTASEQNNDRFEVERSWDGKNFEKIGYRTGHGSTPISQTYNFSDVEVSKYPQANVAYYRLKQIDFDGQFTYTQIVPVTLFRENKEVTSIFPNPTNDVLNVELSATTEDFTVEIFDLTGKLLSSQIGAPSESQIIKIDISSFPKNIYVLKISTKDRIICSERVVKM